MTPEREMDKPTMLDALGNPATTKGAALEAVNAFVSDFLGYRRGASSILVAAEKYPEAALIQIYAGILWMLAESLTGPPKAKTYLLRAKALGAALRPRDALLLEALEAWIAEDRNGAKTALQAVVRAYPRDLAAVKLHQMLSFNRGQTQDMLSIAALAAQAAPEIGYAHSMLAFPMEELNQLRDAEAEAKQALALEPDDPWAQHVLAHVMLAEGRVDEGTAFLEEAKVGWEELNSFMLTHLYWHLALFYLSQGRETDALALFDQKVWAADKSMAQDQAGAVSLLARLELAGVDVGGRWRDLGGWLQRRAEDAYEPFLAVQYLYGLTRAELDAEALSLISHIKRRADTDPDPVWRNLALPLAEGLYRQARGDAAAADALLSPVLANLESLGGSHAQRDFFELVALDAMIKCGKLSEAVERLERRRWFDPEGAVLNRTLAALYTQLNRPDDAAVASDRLQRRLAAPPALNKSAA